MEIAREGWQNSLWRCHHGYHGLDSLEEWQKTNQSFDAVLGSFITQESLDAARKCSQHVITLSSTVSVPPGIWQVAFDSAQIGRVAAEYLCSCKIAVGCFFGPEDHLGFRMRNEAFQSYLKARNIPFLGAYSRLEDIPLSSLRGVTGPIGFFTGDDECANNLLIHLVNEGIAVPYKALVLGVNDQEYLCHLCPVPISSVRLDAIEMGRACNELLRHFAHLRCLPEPAQRFIPAIGVMPRASTDPNLMGNTLAGRAIAALRVVERVPQNVGEWAELVASSRRPLERALRLSLGQTPKRFLDAERARRAIFLLRTTTIEMERIAERTGFSSARHMRETLRRTEGRTPRDFRPSS